MDQISNTPRCVACYKEKLLNSEVCSHGYCRLCLKKFGNIPEYFKVLCLVLRCTICETEVPAKIQKRKLKQQNSKEKGNIDGKKPECLGLPNVGFSCYRNCVLQVLAETPYFLERLGRFLYRLMGSPQEKNKWIYLLQMVLVAIRSKSTQYHTEEIQQFHHEFNKSHTGYSEYVQEDCLSFLTTLLNGIQEAHQGLFYNFS